MSLAAGYSCYGSISPKQVDDYPRIVGPITGGIYQIFLITVSSMHVGFWRYKHRKYWEVSKNAPAEAQLSCFIPVVNRHFSAVPCIIN